MFDLNRKIIFTHPQKCGGTTIEAAFGWHPTSSPNKSEEYINLFRKFKHASLTQHVEHIESLGYSKNEFFKFTCVRNPWDMAVSRFHHDKKDKNVPDCVKKMSFDEYIEFKCKQQMKSKKIKFLNVDMFLYHKNQPCIDYVIKLENYEQDFQPLKEKFGVKLPKTIFNLREKCTYDIYQNYYSSPKTKKLVEEASQTLIKMFDYKF
jgi:hypothetical protein